MVCTDAWRSKDWLLRLSWSLALPAAPTHPTTAITEGIVTLGLQHPVAVQPTMGKTWRQARKRSQPRDWALQTFLPWDESWACGWGWDQVMGSHLTGAGMQAHGDMSSFLQAEPSPGGQSDWILPKMWVFMPCKNERCMASQQQDEKDLSPSPQQSSCCSAGTPCQEHSLLQPLAVLGRTIAEHKHQETSHFLL